METVTKKKMYEGMFLVDSAKAGSDWDGIIAAITKILERAEAEIVSIRKWEDRRLAYEIKHVGRGTYILVYFRVDGENIQGIEKAVQLSEQILRVLILSAEHMTAEDIEKDTPATKAEKEETKPVSAPEKVEKPPVKSPDDQEESPVAETSEEAKAVTTVDDAVTKEVAEVAEAAEEATTAEAVAEEAAGDVEPAEGEEESQPKTALDD